jgi:hypothetical protein
MPCVLLRSCCACSHVIVAIDRKQRRLGAGGGRSSRERRRQLKSPKAPSACKFAERLISRPFLKHQKQLQLNKPATDAQRWQAECSRAGAAVVG